MNNLYDVLAAFSVQQEKIHNTLSPLAIRSGITEDSALILVLLSIDSSQKIFSEKFFSELLEKELILNENEFVKLTGKGSILAKSFSLALQKADC